MQHFPNMANSATQTAPVEDCVLLKKANKKITDLKEDIRRLSGKFKKKDSLLTSFMDVDTGQSKRIATLNTDIQDTVLWDLSTCPRPDSC